MHRILNIAGNEKNKDDLIEQPVAVYFFKCRWFKFTKIVEKFTSLKNNIRALEISNLNSSAQIDNYLLKTIDYAKVVVLRFSEIKAWNYGIEQPKLGLIIKGS